ncbi:hypothetical protein G7046_g4034 [Stylonectria norvegica]|nr:hypothetical protein G7046_g4034 [Stylonectria norvegica]
MLPLDDEEPYVPFIGPRERPYGYEEPQVFVINPVERPLGWVDQPFIGPLNLPPAPPILFDGPPGVMIAGPVEVNDSSIAASIIIRACCGVINGHYLFRGGLSDNMASPMFHSFLNLPYELRRQIWESAARPTGPKHAGIHHFSVFINSQIKDDTTKPRRALKYRPDTDDRTYVAVVPDPHEDSNVDRSAYLWDAGLWTACKESREVIVRHLQVSNSLEKGKLMRMQYYLPSLPAAVRDENWKDHQEVATFINAPTQNADGIGENRQLMVYPYQDLFVLDLEGISKAPKEAWWWRKVLDHLRFSPFIWDGGTIKHLAFEFDPSWKLPQKWSGDMSCKMLYDELTPRGGFVQAIFGILYNFIGCRVWLIDRGTIPGYKEIDRRNMYTEIGEHVRSPVYYDCDGEFVEVDWRASVHRLRENDIFGRSTAAGFLEELMDWLNQDIYQSREFDGYEPGTFLLDPEDNLGVLVRRDMIEEWGSSSM